MSERFDELRELIAANDRRLVGVVNARLELVAELWRLKEQLGVDRIDLDRERALRAELAQTNAGPLSSEGLEHLIGEVLALTKRELGR